MNDRETGRVLADVSGRLSELSRNPMTRQVLRQNAIQLRLGAVRVLMLGNSNAGKSTVVNALLRQIAVPESGTTSSPIPVWFSAGESSRYCVYADDEDGEPVCDEPDRDLFVKKYCFSIADILDDKRTRFQNIGWASAETDCALLKETGAALIDTLGIAATDADTAKTIKVIDGGVDIVVFVTNHVQMLQSEIAFLREKVLGLEQRRDVPYPIRPSQLLIVYNDHGAGGTHEQMSEAAGRLLRGCDDEEIRRFRENNLFRVNALAARLERCGAYDYHAFAPEGTPQSVMASLEELAAQDREALQINRELIRGATASFDRLEERIRALSREQMSGEDGAVKRRMIDLESVMKQIRVQANASLSVLQGDQAAIRQKIDAVSRLAERFGNANEGVREEYRDRRKAMMSAVAKTLAANTGAERAIVGRIYGLEEPPEFMTQESVRAFFAAGSLEQAKMLETWILKVIEKDFLPEASKQFKKTLLEATVQEGDVQFTQEDTVCFQLAAARRLTLQQGTRMKNFCDQLRRCGAEDIGLSVPDDRTIEQWAADMASDMEVSILNAIANLQDEARKKFNETLPKVVREILGKNILEALGRLWMRLTGNVKGFWKAVRDTAIRAAAEAICREWFGANLGNTGNDMYFGIDRAYAAVQEKVSFSLAQQSAQVEAYLTGLEEKGKGAGSAVDAEREKVEQLEETLAGLQGELDVLYGEMRKLRKG